MFNAHVSSLGTKLAKGGLRLREEAPEFIPRSLRLPVWHTRRMPDLAGGAPLVDDLARNLIKDFEVADVWRGEATLEIIGSEFEEVGDLAPQEVLDGARCAIAFTVIGAEVLGRQRRG